MLRNLAAIACLLTAPGVFLLVALEKRLLDARILNTKDLWPIVGKELGTGSEYLLNVWLWDAAVLAVFVLSIPCCLIGVMLLFLPRKQLTADRREGE